MRIAYLTSDFGVPVHGSKGASVHVRRMVGALAQRGHELLVLTPNVGADANETLCNETLCAEVEPVVFDGGAMLVLEALGQEEAGRGNRLKNDLRNLLYSLWLENRVGVRLSSFAADFLYERYTIFNTAGVELARRFDVPLVLEVNAPLVEEQREQRGLHLPRVAAQTERWIFSQADELVVVSRWLADYVVAHGAAPEHVTVVPNAADPELFRPATGPSALRRRLGWEACTVLGFVGAMKPWHGVDTLITALLELDAPRSGFRLLLVGEGPELAATRARVHALGLDGVVHFAGSIPHSEIPEWLSAVDVALAPYAPSAPAYFSPVKLFEYMAMGLPVVCARLGQTQEIVAHGRTGWLYDPCEPGALSGALRRLAREPEACRAAGAAARELVLREHTWEHNAEIVEGLATRALARRGALAGNGRALS
jgi:glycosyltransferase involved in cell wall biosynthesis